MKSRLTIWSNNRMTCFECGREAAYRHHVIPKSRGGEKTVPLCGRCHSLVHGRRALDTAGLTRDALQRLRASGMKTGGDVPFGYRARKGKLYQDAKEQEAVRLVLGLRKKGASLWDICRDLDGKGITPKRGGAWHPMAVSRIVGRAANRKSVETMDVDKAMHLAQMAETRAGFERYLIEPVEG